MNNAETFLDLYKQLEQTAVAIYSFPSDGTAVSRLERMPQYRDIRQQLKYCREVRALLTHNPKIDGQFAVTPSNVMIATLKSAILRISEPTRCSERAIKGENIMSATMEDEILPKMKLMRMFGYSFIPILKNQRVVGVFGKNTIFAYVMDTMNSKISEGMKFSDMSNYMSLNKKDKDSYKFIKKDTYLFEAEQLVINAFKHKERINLMFLTENGRADEPLWGIITPWDVMEN